jgi:hypothetical protein
MPMTHSFGLGHGQGDVERGFGQLGHGHPDGGKRRAGFDILGGQAFDDQLAGHAQGTGDVASACAEVGDQGGDVGAAGDAGTHLRKMGQLFGIAAPDALHVARMRRRAGRLDGVKRKIEHGSAPGSKGCVLGLPLVEARSLPPWYGCGLARRVGASTDEFSPACLCLLNRLATPRVATLP